MTPGLAFDEATHTYTFNGRIVPHITGILKACGWIDDRWFKEEHCYRGRVVHRGCWYLAEGDLDRVAFEAKWPEFICYIKAFEKFLADTGFRPDWCERPLYSRVYQFAGTPDLKGPYQSRPAVIDIKTGEPGLAARMQTAAQALLVEENEGLKNVARWALQLLNHGTYKMHPYLDDSDKLRFIADVSNVHFRRNHGQ